MSKKILIACEESQTITIEFRKLGFEAFSCDIQECSGGHPEWHFQKDVFEVINEHKFDLMIGHPPCTFLTITGNSWFNIDKYGEKAIQRHKEKDLAINFFIKLWNAEIKHICLENPIGFINNKLKPSQIIQPYYFGDSFQKTTCLWLKNLPKLYHNKSVNLFDKEVTHTDKGEFFEWVDKKTGVIKRQPLWFYNALKESADKRAEIRSKTFSGIAEAMVNQWDNYFTFKYNF